jgi:hypothetical protein
MRADGRTDGRTDRQTDGRTDRQTDITKLRVAFHNFAKAPKKYYLQKISNIAQTLNQLCLQIIFEIAYTFLHILIL